MPAGEIGQLIDVVAQQSLLPAGHVGCGDGAGQAAVAFRAAGQHQQVLPCRVGDAGAGDVGFQRELRTEHRGQAVLAGGLGEADHAVEAVVIGQGQCLQIQPGGLGDHLLGHRRPVEEAVGAVSVQFGVGHRRGDLLHRIGGESATLA